MIQNNLKHVEENIIKACKKVGRDPNEVTLIAVSKTKPVDAIQQAIDYGIQDFGENKVQELTSKIEAIPEKLNWHLIGHLQRNKVKYIIDSVCLIHSVDSIRLAMQIEEEARKKGIIANILIEVNIAKEESKFGVAKEDVPKVLKEIKNLKHVCVKGLMTIAPYVENAEENRKYFSEMYKLFIDMRSENADNIRMEILSMGMTGDYQVAVEEGATMVRVGTGIFGERDYTI
ncbi:MAG: YggS family pyridoxal phosphate-dependent enzyme [Lachnospiraceae bacterium]|nr:YggS family pyridoxal phosphate-dependent enzyme [Lachnospiraceae bacterium]